MTKASNTSLLLQGAKIKDIKGGFPGGAVVESPPADAGDTGSCPGPGRSRMPRSGWAREPWPLSLCVLEPVLHKGRGPNSERPAYHKKNKKTKKNPIAFEIIFWEDLSIARHST